MRGVILDTETGRPVRSPDTPMLLRELSIHEKDPERRASLLRVLENLSLGVEHPHVKMSKQFWRQFDQASPLVADASAVVGTAEAILVPAQNSFLPAYYWYAGKTAELNYRGKLTTAASTPGNMTLTGRAGTTTGGTSLAASAATALTTSKTNISISIEMLVTCRTDGATGTLIAVGNFTCDGAGNVFSTAGNNPMFFPATAPATATVDCTASGGLVITATLGSASDSMTIQIATIESVN